MIFRRVFNFLFVIFYLYSPAFAGEYNAALVADMDTGQVLYSEHANDLNYPASLTKIMTLYLTFDALEHGRLKLDDYLIVSQSAANASPVKLGLAAGSKIKVEDAIKAVAVHSANDVARVLAENLKGGKEGNFASLMTQVAGEIGLSKTNFENSSGLPDDDHLSSARDIALLSMAVYKHFPQYWKYFGILSWSYNGQTYVNGNRLLGNYPGADGMKTGYTNKSKYSLVATAKRGDKHLMSVVLGATNKDVRTNVSSQMLDKGFAQLGINAGTIAPTRAAWDENTDTFSGGWFDGIESNPPSPAEPIPRRFAPPPPVTPIGNVGVQFGAFSSRSAAITQADRVHAAFGINAIIESTSTGMHRVRINGLSESAAAQIKSSCAGVGIECFVFH